MIGLKHSRGLCLWALLLVLVVVVLLCRRSSRPGGGLRAAALHVIPKRIWIYWNGPMHELVERCIERCKRLNPEYEVNILNRENVRDFLPELPIELLNHRNFTDFEARTSDLIRSFAIAHKGGIWMDASIFCLLPFDEWLDRKSQFVGFFLKGFTEEDSQNKYPNPVIENWFFASHPGCPFMQEWCREFSRMSEFDSVQAYIDHLKKDGVSFQKISSPNYLAMHCAAQKVMQQTLPGVAESLTLKPAEEGPFKYLHDHWDSKRGINQVVSDWDQLRNDKVPFLKFRGLERKAVDDMTEEDRRAFYEVLKVR